VEPIDYISVIHCSEHQLSLSYQLSTIKLVHCGSKLEMYIFRDAAQRPSIYAAFRDP